MTLMIRAAHAWERGLTGRMRDLSSTERAAEKLRDKISSGDLAGERVSEERAAADPGGGQLSWWGGPFPGQAQVVSERSGEPELGIGDDDEPGPAIRGLWVTDLRRGPAEDLLEHPEGVLQDQTGARTPAIAGPPGLGRRRWPKTTATRAWGCGHRAGDRPAA